MSLFLTQAISSAHGCEFLWCACHDVSMWPSLARVACRYMKIYIMLRYVVPLSSTLSDFHQKYTENWGRTSIINSSRGAWDPISWLPYYQPSQNSRASWFGRLSRPECNQNLRSTSAYETAFRKNKRQRNAADQQVELILGDDPWFPDDFKEISDRISASLEITTGNALKICAMEDNEFWYLP